MVVQRLPAQLLTPTVRDRIAPFLAEAVAESAGEYEVADLFAEIARNRMQLWIIGDAERLRGGLVTRVAVYPRKQVLQLLYLGGDGLADWVDDLDQELSGFARAQGCQRIEVTGRPGWGRILPQRGAEVRQVVVSREVEHG